MSSVPVLYGGVCALLGVAALGQYALMQRTPDTLAAPLHTIPLELGGWQSAGEIPVAERVLAKLRPTEMLARTYRKGGQEVELFISYYSQQRAGESMHSPKNCLPGSGWEIWKHGTAELPAGSRRLIVNDFSIQNGPQRMRMMYWYQSRQRIIANEYHAKVLLIRDAFLDGQTAGSIVRVTMADTPEAVAGAREFAALVLPYVQRCLGVK